MKIDIYNTSNKYRTIYADPPWEEQGGGAKYKRGADRHYNLMKLKDIIAMGSTIEALTEPDAHLYLWTTNSFLEKALQVMKAWGFTYKTTITWNKNSIGLGQYFRGMSEHCLFGVKGMVPYKVIDGKRQQGRTSFYAPKTFHSQKPNEMRQMIETVSTGAYLELFARAQHKNWDCWGNEV